MAGEQPWEADWEVVRELGRGGQGTTYEVVSKADRKLRGVVKKLRNNKDPQARGRMHQEVSSLGVLASVGLKVPRVFGGNTDKYADNNTQLYFVMEYVTGRTLTDEVQAAGRLPLEVATGITADLSQTVSAAHQHRVIHRDLKPDNIVIRSLSPADAVIVDYGVSFNEDRAEESVTRTGDSFRNKFLDLPETNTPNGDLRDRRSDVTAIGGILYYCLTGHIPGQLRDGRGMPPHRRAGFSARDVLGADPRCEQLEVLLDQAFAVPVQDRFQTCDELVSRLSSALTPTERAGEDPLAVIAAAERHLQQHDRKTQLVQATSYLQPVWTGMLQYVTQKFSRTTVFHIGVGQLVPMQTTLPEGFDPVANGLSLSVQLPAHELARIILFGFGSKGAQCVLLRNIVVQQAQGSAYGSGPWEQLFWFSAEPNMAMDKFHRAIDQSVILAVRQLQQEVSRQQQ